MHFSDDLVSAAVSFIKQIQGKGIDVLLSDVRFLVVLASVSLALLIIVALRCCGKRDKSSSGKRGEKSKTEWIVTSTNLHTEREHTGLTSLKLIFELSDGCELAELIVINNWNHEMRKKLNLFLWIHFAFNIFLHSKKFNCCLFINEMNRTTKQN